MVNLKQNHDENLKLWIVILRFYFHQVLFIIGMFSLSHEQNKAPFYGTFSRHDRIKASFILLIWLNENVRFNYAVARKQRRMPI